MALYRSRTIKKPKDGLPQATLRNSGKRLSEMLSVLRRHRVAEGLDPVKLREIFEELGPTFVKLGQIMSLRSDMLPKEYCDELAKLRMEVEHLPWSVMKDHLEAEMGRSVEEAFESIETDPLGSASIAQVYRAHLKTGEEVAVKVQRPGIVESMTQDISMMSRAVDTLDVVRPRAAAEVMDMVDLHSLVDELWNSLQREVDFLQEADNIKEFSANNRSIAYIGTPKVYDEFCSPQVLVMDYVHGIPIDDVAALKKAGYDLSDIGIKLAENYTKQILDDGFFHADPHPGNLLVSDGKIMWIDFGMMGRFSNQDRLVLRSIITAMVAGDATAVKEGLLTVGDVSADVDHPRMLADIEAMLKRYGFTDIEDLDMGSALADLFELVRRNHIKLPTSYVMLGRGYVTLEATLAACRPEQSTLQIMSAHLRGERINLEELRNELTQMLLSSRTSAVKLASLPARLSDLVDMMAHGQIKTNMDLTGSEAPIARAGVILDRLGIALVSCALFIGSSILCLSDMHPKLLGIPILGFAGYVGAFGLSVWYICTVWRRDKRRR